MPPPNRAASIQSSAAAPVVLIGASSRAARAIRAALPGRRCIGVGRHGPEADIVIADYEQVPEGLAFAGASVVNCVGIDRGEPALLERLNVEVPLSWAEAARDGGARTFVQLSSFSVYAPTDKVRADSALAPAGAYGRSKLAAERALTALAAPGFDVALLRVPILVSAPDAGGPPDKLAQLLRAVRAVRMVPRIDPPPRRAMLSYAGLAAAVAAALDERRSGVLTAADPEPFSYELVAKCAREAGLGIVRVPVPARAARLAARLHPALARLLAPMALADEVNLLAGCGGYLTLRDIVHAHLRG